MAKPLSNLWKVKTNLGLIAKTPQKNTLSEAKSLHQTMNKELVKYITNRICYKLLAS